MRILLIGEYSNFHNSLKQGLLKKGHEVILAAEKDGFKSLPVDISLNPELLSKTPLKYIRHALFKLTKFDLAYFEILWRFIINRKLLKGYDSVQLINEFPFKTNPFFDKLMLSYIFKHNQNVSLSACGDDYTYISYLLNAKLPYHILTPFLSDSDLAYAYKHSLKYLKPSFIKLSCYVRSNVTRIIPANLDYFMAYQGQPKVTTMIPFPINIDKFTYKKPNITKPITVFHGINTINYFKKGNNFFEEALTLISSKYTDQVEIDQVKSIPYKEYIQLYNQSHILLDQTFSFSQGYNALEAMATGKVVFTGMSELFKTHYKLDKNIGIEAVPDTKIIFEKLENLILNPKKIEEIGLNARWFIETYHDYEKVANSYLICWGLMNS